MLSGELRAPMQPRGPAGVDQQHIRRARGNVACTRRRLGARQTSICHPTAAVAVVVVAAAAAAPPSGSALRVRPGRIRLMLFICCRGGKTETSRGIDPAIDSGDGSFLRHRVVKLPGESECEGVNGACVRNESAYANLNWVNGGRWCQSPVCKIGFDL